MHDILPYSICLDAAVIHMSLLSTQCCCFSPLGINFIFVN